MATDPEHPEQCSPPADPGSLHAASRRRKHNEKMKRYYATHPEQAKKKNERVKARYHSDPEYAERVRARARLQAAQRKGAVTAGNA